MSSGYAKIIRGMGRWRERYGDRALTALAFMAALPLSFVAGTFVSDSGQVEPIRIEIPAVTAPTPVVAGADSVSDAASAVAPTPAVRTECAYVGSRNSNLYHLPSCAPAKRIKPENIVCFASAEDAAAKGYKPGCLK